MFGRDPGRLGTTTRPLVALVTIVDTGSERMFSRIFATSPIRIGSHRACDLHLRHPQVARCHGEISFEPGSACFLNRAWSKQTSVDEWRLTRGEAVWLTERSVIALGPFRIDISWCKPRLRDAERSRKVTPLVLPCLPPAELADSSVAVELSAPAEGRDAGRVRSSANSSGPGRPATKTQEDAACFGVIASTLVAWE